MPVQANRFQITREYRGDLTSRVVVQFKCLLGSLPTWKKIVRCRSQLGHSISCGKYWRRLRTHRVRHTDYDAQSVSRPFIQAYPKCYPNGTQRELTFSAQTSFSCKFLIFFNKMVPGGGFEPPTRGFSILVGCWFMRLSVKMCCRCVA